MSSETPVSGLAGRFFSTVTAYMICQNGKAKVRLHKIKKRMKPLSQLTAIGFCISSKGYLPRETTS